MEILCCTYFSKALHCHNARQKKPRLSGVCDIKYHKYSLESWGHWREIKILIARVHSAAKIKALSLLLNWSSDSVIFITRASTTLCPRIVLGLVDAVFNVRYWLSMALHVRRQCCKAVAAFMEVKWSLLETTNGVGGAFFVRSGLSIVGTQPLRCGGSGALPSDVLHNPGVSGRRRLVVQKLDDLLDLRIWPLVYRFHVPC